MSKGSINAVLVVLAFVLALATPLSGQTFRGQVRGLITDQTGAVVPGATVTLSNTKTGINSNKHTDSAGLYIFDFVEPGTYTVGV
jgi:hypothetical protein